MTKTDSITIDQIAALLDVDKNDAENGRFEIADGIMHIYNVEAGYLWSYDGGAGGYATGLFQTIDEVIDWRAANADAIIQHHGSLAMTTEEIDDLKQWLAGTVKNWDALNDSQRLAWSLEAIDIIENTLSNISDGSFEVRPWDSISGLPETFTVNHRSAA
jgi:hypothetical protein